jgi:heme A synthase
MADLTSPNQDADRDGMPDVTNAKMPAIAFITAIIGLIPTLYAIQYSIDTLRGQTNERLMAFVLNFLAIACATGAIVAAAYGSRAATRGLATGGRWIAISEMIIAILLVITMFFQKS